MSAAFDFLINTADGLLMNLGVSGMVGQLMGVGNHQEKRRKRLYDDDNNHV
ncbi:MAG: hypothetical protein SAK29_05790 [Scytonema sp. PMC 1069.18]|nr:hypothetical protein [Scytonema sp. PMC 1069.18]MEC4885942.1 hypothetical protein [Scytonema sp. PMC 1070.18]